jgi:hypothetical protein
MDELASVVQKQKANAQSEMTAIVVKGDSTPRAFQQGCY